MRKLFLAAGATIAFASAAFAIPALNPAIRPAASELNAAQIEQVQFRFGGHRHCWYARGWNGPGWYWCGYSHKRNSGWGGPEGWNNWRHR